MEKIISFKSISFEKGLLQQERNIFLLEWSPFFYKGDKNFQHKSALPLRCAHSPLISQHENLFQELINTVTEMILINDWGEDSECIIFVYHYHSLG